jgi:hypothetical protein
MSVSDKLSIVGQVRFRTNAQHMFAGLLGPSLSARVPRSELLGLNAVERLG